MNNKTLLSLVRTDLISTVREAFESSRTERGIPVAELSRRISVSEKRLWYVLRGQREMRVDEFLKLCIALRMDPRSFVTREMIDGIAEATARSINRAQH